MSLQMISVGKNSNSLKKTSLAIILVILLITLSLSFAPEVRANEPFNPEVKVYENYGQSTQTEPSIAVDGNYQMFTRSNGTLNWSNDVCLTNSQSNSTRPSVAIDESGTLHLVWVDDRNKGQLIDSEVFYQSSINGGNTWSELTILALQNSYCYSPVNVQLAYNKNSNTNHLFFVDDRYTQFPTTLYTTSSYDGESWEMAEPIYTSDYGHPLDYLKIEITSSGNFVHFAMAPFLESGANEIMVYSMNATENNYKMFHGIFCPSIGCQDNNVYVVIPTENGLNFSKSNDNGFTWHPPVEISSLTALTSTLLVYKENLYLVWASNVSGNYELYFKKTNDGGDTWCGDIRLTHATYYSLQPSLSMDSAGNFNIVWQDFRDDDWEIYYKKIDGNGTTLINDTRLTDSIGLSQYPEVVTDTLDYTYVIWQDDRNGNWNLYFKRFPANDITPPVIEHEPMVSAYVNDTVSVNATVVDNFGVESVILHYGNGMLNITQTLEFNLTDGTVKNGTWNTQFTPSDLKNRTIYYYIEANDTWNSPRTPIYLVKLIGSPPYLTKPMNTTADVGVGIGIEISIKDEFGVDYVVLFYKESTCSEYSNVPMDLVSGTKLSGIWRGIIPPLNRSSNLTYYVEAHSGTETNLTEKFTLEVRSIQNPGNGSENYFYLSIGIAIPLVSVMTIIFVRRNRVKRRRDLQ
jgi:hypothetical protein